MVHIDWFAALLGISVMLVLALHGSLWVAHTNHGEREVRARSLAARLYWPVCGLVFTLGVAILSLQPWLAESLNWRPEIRIFPIIGVSGLLGMHLCLGARWSFGSVLCSTAFIVGLLCSGIFVYRHSVVGPHDRLNVGSNAETYSVSGRSTPGERTASNYSRECRL